MAADSGDLFISATHKHHLVALDSVRGLAALTVALFHFGAVVPMLSKPLASGYLMVDLFFVLSGFAIFYAYYDRLQNLRQLARFVWLRFWRLYPLHLATLLFLLVLELAKIPLAGHVPMNNAAFAHNTIGDFFANLFLLQAMNVSQPAFNGPAWSISAEFWTYLVCAAVVMAMPRRGAMLVLCTLIAALSSICLIAFWPALIQQTDFGWLGCFAGFFLGALVCGAYQTLAPRVRRHGGWIGAAALIMLLVFAVFIGVKEPQTASDFATIPMAAILVLLVALASPSGPARVLGLKPLPWLGEISYSIYMVHGLFVYAWPHIWQPSADVRVQLAQLLVYLILLFAIAGASFRWLERPFRMWSRRKFPAAAA